MWCGFGWHRAHTIGARGYARRQQVRAQCLEMFSDLNDGIGEVMDLREPRNSRVRLNRPPSDRDRPECLLDALNGGDYFRRVRGLTVIHLLTSLRVGVFGSSAASWAPLRRPGPRNAVPAATKPRRKLPAASFARGLPINGACESYPTRLVLPRRAPNLARSVRVQPR